MSAGVAVRQASVAGRVVRRRAVSRIPGARDAPGGEGGSG